MMQEAEFKAGEFVQVASGGPRMTVEQVAERNGHVEVWCIWFDGKTKKEDTFLPTTLKRVNGTSSLVA
jgi:uncharacterized protein YodC (DUF2158 family)